MANQEAYLARPSRKEDRDIQRARILLEEQIVDEIELGTEVDRCITGEVQHKNVAFQKWAYTCLELDAQISIQNAVHVLIVIALANYLLTKMFKELALLRFMALFTRVHCLVSV